jgi:hypothetical protein
LNGTTRKRGTEMDETKKKRLDEKLQLTQQLVNGLTAGEWRNIREIIDRQYEEKAFKLALDDLSCESIKKQFKTVFYAETDDSSDTVERLAAHLHKALESTLKSNS